MTTVLSTVVAVKPGASLAWLQASQSPCPLVALVGPPAWSGTTWSWWRMGASHHGVRHDWSRRSMKSPRLAGKARARESIAT
ncbi:MAG: hypothetical protein ABF306_07045, partial [Nocardioides marinisabuli]